MALLKTSLVDPFIDSGKKRTQIREEKAQTPKTRDFKWIERRLDLEKMEVSLHP